MRALVIDDSRPIRGIIAKIMRGLNFETHEAENGSAGWDILSQQGPFDIVTVNWEMPEMDGLQFVTKVRKQSRYRDLPLLMISSISDPNEVERALEKGANEYIVKPCTAKTLTGKLKQLGLLTEEGVAIGTEARPSQKFATKKAADQRSSSSETQSGRLDNPSNEKRPAATMNRLSKGQDSTEGPLEIKILVVDDSSIVRNVIKSTLEAVGGFKVSGNATDGIEALQYLRSQQFDVVLLDIEMPRMDGLELLRRMRQESLNVPVVMFSSRTDRGAKATPDALLLGAKDFVFKPGGPRMTDLRAGEAVIREQLAPRLNWLCERSRLRKRANTKDGQASTFNQLKRRIDLVVIAASTGGPAALAKLFADAKLCESLNKPILVVQHMPSLFTKYLAERLSSETGLDIAEASEGEVLKPGMIRIAQGGNHLVVKLHKKQYVTSIDRSPAVNSCRPSADVLFGSAAEAVAGGVLGVVLTGMGHDGRDGCRAIREKGGTVIAQDETTSVVWGMPGSVVASQLADHIEPIEVIGKKISSFLRRES